MYILKFEAKNRTKLDNSLYIIEFFLYLKYFILNKK